MKKPNFSKEQSLYVKKYKCKQALIHFCQIAVLIAFLGLWELCAYLNIIDSYIFSSPTKIVKTLIHLFAKQNLMKDVLVTLYETFLGFIIATSIGYLVALMFWWSKTLQRILDPYVVVLNALPKIALGPLIVIWFGTGMTAIIVMCILIAVIISIITMTNAFNNVENEKILMLKTLGATKLQILTKLVIPQTIPDFISLLKINVGMSFVGSIMGEYLSSTAGLGFLIDYNSSVFKLSVVMSCIIVLCALAAFMYLMVSLIEKIINKRKK